MKLNAGDSGGGEEVGRNREKKRNTPREPHFDFCIFIMLSLVLKAASYEYLLESIHAV